MFINARGERPPQFSVVAAALTVKDYFTRAPLTHPDLARNAGAMLPRLFSAHTKAKEPLLAGLRSKASLDAPS